MIQARWVHWWTSIDIANGELSGPWTVNGDLTNAGLVDLVGTPGTLTVNGDYSQTTTGILDLKWAARLPAPITTR